MASWNPFAKKKTKPLPESEKQEEGKNSNSLVPDAPVVSTEPDVSSVAEKPAKASIFSRFKSALKKTVQILNTDIRDLVKDGRLVDDEFLEELYRYLIKTDMGTNPAAEICDHIRTEYRGRKVFMRDLIKVAKQTILGIMQHSESPLKRASQGTTVIMICGVNGSGKTTSIAKLSKMFADQNLSVVLGAGDTFRAAAVEQLSIWADRLKLQLVKGKPNADPASVAFQAVEQAVKTNADICIIDTAGRLQTQTNLMDQLGKIRRVIAKVIPDAPHEVLLVLDATAGQNAISQARGFSKAAECTGIILAKLDGTAKGGVAIPIRREFGLPVKYVGLGEKPEDLAVFNVENFVDAFFDECEEQK